MSLKRIQNAIGKKLKALRISKNLSQEQVSYIVKISRDHLSNIENGKYPLNIYHFHILCSPYLPHYIEKMKLYL